jgi:hypothetical protein
MVIYFGDTQYDLLDTASVVPFASKPRPAGRGSGDVAKAYAIAQERQAALSALA